MPTQELERATALNRELEGRWVSLFTHLARASGTPTGQLVLELGDEGSKAIQALAQAQTEHPTATFNDLHFLPFPAFAKLASKKRRELEQLGAPPVNWIAQINQRMGPLTRYRNHLSHVDRFDFLSVGDRTQAVEMYAEHVNWLKDWFPAVPQLKAVPPVEQTGMRAALSVLDRDEQSARALAKELGFDVVKSPSNLVAEDANNDIREALKGLVPRMYRVGGRTFGDTGVALFIAYIEHWPERSSEREQYRRRIATAVTRYRNKLLAQRCLVVMLDNGSGRNEAEDARGHYEAEFIYPTESPAGRGVRTVRATVDLSKPTRFHVELLESLKIKGLTSVQLISKRWNQAFSVEAVTRSFFAELRALRDRIARAFLTANSGHPVLGAFNVIDYDTAWKSANSMQRDIQMRLNTLATRLLCRLLFLWFLQQKGWLGSPLAEGSRTFLTDLYRFRPKDQPDSYFSRVLVPLFFDGIGSPTATTEHKAVRDNLTGLLKKIITAEAAVPYLNGGLFRPDYDPFEASVFGINEDGQRTLDVILPDALFEEHEGDILLGKVKRRGKQPLERTVLGLLGRYRFTTQESTPDDQSIDPDPELLGKVFEDLYQSDERHETGAYYTPREVVRYMCRRALDGYLRDTSGLNQEMLNQLRLEAEDWESSSVRLSMSQERKLQSALDDVTIVDPAVGSGAFLVGMLQEIVLLRRGITAAQDDHAIGTGSRRVYDWKLHAITHNLYGVDINPTAVEICRLRLWLSLVIDFEPNDLLSIPALPNLEFRIVAGDSLIDRMGAQPFPDSLPKVGATAISFDTERRYRELAGHETAFQEAEDKGQVRRLPAIASRIRDTRREIALSQMEWALEGAHGRLSVLERDPSAKNARAATNLRTEIANLEHLREGLRPDAPFLKPLLWPLAFPHVFDRGGFDVVVANPPYVRQESLAALDQKVYETAFADVYAGTADLFVFFFARALQVLRPGGWLAFITSNKYMRAAFGAKLRQALPAQTRIEEVIDFGDLPVFEVAAYPAVVVAQKLPPETAADPAQLVTVADLIIPIRQVIAKIEGAKVNTEGVRAALGDLPGLIERAAPEGFGQGLLKGEGWILEDPTLIRLFNRLMNEGTPLGEYVNGRMYRGVLTGLNEAFVIDQTVRDQLVAADPASAEIIKPWLRGRDIKRWKADWAGLYLIAIQNSGDKDATNPWAKAASEADARRTFTATYPALHDHLSQWEDKLRPRADQGKYWWELRACAYYREFEHSKAFWPDIAVSPRFSFETGNHFGGNTLYFSPALSKMHVALLNSAVGAFLMDRVSPAIRGGYRRYFTQYVSMLPLPNTISISVIDSVESATDTELENMATDIGFTAYRLTDSEREALASYFQDQPLSMGSGEDRDDERDEE